MARLLISLFSHRTRTLSARWCLSLILVWSILGPITAFEFNSPVYAETGSASPANHPTLKQAKRLIDAGQAEEAITTLRRFLATSPKPELLDDTYLLLGAALHKAKQYMDALKYLQQLQTEFPDSEVTERGKLMQARVHAAMGNLDLALPILTGLRNLSKDDSTKREALRLSGDFYAQKKDATRAIQAWLDEVALGTDDQAEDVRTRIRDLASETSDKKALDQIRDTFPRSFPGDLASLRLIDLYVARGEEHQAIRQIQQFLMNFPTHNQRKPRNSSPRSKLNSNLTSFSSPRFCRFQENSPPLPVKFSAGFSWRLKPIETGQGARRSVLSSKIWNRITPRF